MSFPPDLRRLCMISTLSVEDVIVHSTNEKMMKSKDSATKSESSSGVAVTVVLEATRLLPMLLSNAICFTRLGSIAVIPVM